MYFLPAYRRGVFNRYRKGMPWTEMLVKDVRFLIDRWKRAAAGKRRQRILCYPHLPSSKASISRIARALDMEVSNKVAGPFAACMYWEYATYRSEWDGLTPFMPGVINYRSRNNAKDFLDEKMVEVFGYGTRIDPTLFQGPAVRKSVINALHNGEMVHCPTSAEEGWYYQRLVDSRQNEQEVMDIRVPIMRQRIPHVYRNYRSSDARFVNVPARAELDKDVNALLSAREQAQLIALAGALGMEFAEFDVLRDVSDGRIYVVDANNTPNGPPKNLSPVEKAEAIARMAKAFQQEFLK